MDNNRLYEAKSDLKSALAYEDRFEKRRLESESAEREVCTMLAAVKGIVQGNTVVIEDDDIREYDGAEVIVTLLSYPKKKVKKAPVDWDSFVIPSERGKNVEKYMREMRENDRL